jgi:F-type H+-transporting ATPase subunit delta
MEPIAYRLADVYAEAMLQVTEDNERAEGVYQELLAVLGLLDDLSGFEDFLTMARLSRQDRQAAMGRIFAGRVSQPVEGLLGVMGRNGRAGLLRPMVRRFRELLNQREGKVEVSVTTAVPVEEAARRDLVQTLRDVLGAEPLLQTTVDGEILGGMIVRIGDKVYDASVAADLMRLGKAMASADTKPGLVE